MEKLSTLITNLIIYIKNIINNKYNRYNNTIIAQYFSTSNINSAKKKTAIILTIIGSDVYSLLRNLLAPVFLSTKTVEELFKILKEHLKP